MDRDQFELCPAHGVDGHYVIRSADVADAASLLRFRPIKNRTPDHSSAAPRGIISGWRHWFVRITSCDDPRIQDTVRLIDTTLKTETRTGPVWHRYNEDGYGEHETAVPSTAPVSAAAGAACRGARTNSPAAIGGERLLRS
jgi:glucoamylase